MKSKLSSAYCGKHVPIIVPTISDVPLMSPTVFFMRTFSTRTVTSLLVSGESVLSVECRFREDPFSFWGDFSESGGEKDCRSNTQNKYLNRAKQKKKQKKNKNKSKQTQQKPSISK